MPVREQRRREREQGQRDERRAASVQRPSPARHYDGGCERDQHDDRARPLEQLLVTPEVGLHQRVAEAPADGARRRGELRRVDQQWKCGQHAHHVGIDRILAQVAGMQRVEPDAKVEILVDRHRIAVARYHRLHRKDGEQRDRGED